MTVTILIFAIIASASYLFADDKLNLRISLLIIIGTLLLILHLLCYPLTEEEKKYDPLMPFKKEQQKEYLSSLTVELDYLDVIK